MTVPLEQAVASISAQAKKKGLNEPSTQLPDDLKQECYKMFLLFDSEADGSITPSDAAIAICLLGYNATEAEMKDAISRRLEAESNMIFLPSFVDIILEYMSTPQPPNELKYAFDTFDENRVGSISIHNLRQSLTKVGEKLTEQEADEFIEALDVDTRIW